MDQPALPLQISPPVKRRGRPPGAANKRSIDLARYVEAQFGGMTPGQQSAALCLVSPKDLKEAKVAAKELGMVSIDLDPITLAMAVKAKRLARAIGCETRDAWLLLAKEREGLMAYVHQKQPQAPPAEKGGAGGAIYIVPDGQDVGMLEIIDDLDPDAIEVA